MDGPSILSALALVLTSLGSAIIALGALSLLTRKRNVLLDQSLPAEDQVVFMFDSTDLHDATPAARHLLAAGQSSLGAFDRLMALLHREFPGLSDKMAKLSELGEVVQSSVDGKRRLEANWNHGLARIALIDDAQIYRAAPLDSQGLAALSGELQLLQNVIDTAPLLVWLEDATGQVCWANAAYIELAETVHPDQSVATWPLPRLFPDHKLNPEADEFLTSQRLSINLPDNKTQNWFECTSQPSKDGLLIFGILADPLVSAERSLREFVQTLSKTFADLPTGLAIFDKKRQLALFNPALIDLTSLEPVFLSTRPTLHAFLDQLREKQRMPEPKNYKSWRQGIAELESAAVNGTYLEDWSLPTGQTYRVTGQPHPDGAVAFLFEDISAEISVTRRFRSELELGQSVIDSLPEAIAVFSGNGTLTLSNKAYVRLWDSNPEESLGEVSVSDAIRHWKSLCQQTNLWSDVRDFVTGQTEREEWVTEVTLDSGQLLLVRMTPLSRAASLIGFTVVGADIAAPNPAIIDAVVTDPTPVPQKG